MSDSSAGLSATRIDYIAAALRGVAGAVPYAGGLVAEIVGTLIPNQRLDRLVSFVRVLDQKFSELDRGLLEQGTRTEEFADLLEDALRQATRATSDERRSYLASLLKNSLTRDELRQIEKKRLLELLGELNDVEVIILQSEAEFYADAHPFSERHREALGEPELRGVPSEARNRAAMHASYRAKLRQLELLEPVIGVSSSGSPLTPARGMPRVEHRGDRITTLGRLLLEFIDSVTNIPEAGA